MKTRLVKIGNSQGIRIPKRVLEEAGIRDEVEIVVNGSHLVISSSGGPRGGWQEAFERLGPEENKELQEWEAAKLTDWIDEEWEW